jgi:hypothetical protein
VDKAIAIIDIVLFEYLSINPKILHNRTILIAFYSTKFGGFDMI